MAVRRPTAFATTCPLSISPYPLNPNGLSKQHLLPCSKPSHCSSLPLGIKLLPPHKSSLLARMNLLPCPGPTPTLWLMLYPHLEHLSYPTFRSQLRRHLLQEAFQDSQGRAGASSGQPCAPVKASLPSCHPVRLKALRGSAPWLVPGCVPADRHIVGTQSTVLE